MAAEKSLADVLVWFLRMRDEAAEKIDALPHEGEAWPNLGMMLEQQERAVRNALHDAAMTADRLGRIAESVTQQSEGGAQT